MLYGFRTSNHLKGYKGLFIFNNEQDAIECHSLLSELWDNPLSFFDEYSDKDFDSVEFTCDDMDFIQSIYDDIYYRCLSYMENTSFTCDDLDEDDVLKDYTYTINTNGLTHSESNDIKILFTNDIPTIPA